MWLDLGGDHSGAERRVLWWSPLSALSCSVRSFFDWQQGGRTSQNRFLCQGSWAAGRPGYCGLNVYLNILYVPVVIILSHHQRAAASHDHLVLQQYLYILLNSRFFSIVCCWLICVSDWQVRWPTEPPSSQRVSPETMNGLSVWFAGLFSSSLFLQDSRETHLKANKHCSC